MTIYVVIHRDFWRYRGVLGAFKSFESANECIHKRPLDEQQYCIVVKCKIAE